MLPFSCQSKKERGFIRSKGSNFYSKFNPLSFFKIVEGKAVRIEVQTGAESGEYTEIISKRSGRRSSRKRIIRFVQWMERKHEKRKNSYGRRKTKKGEEL